MDDLIPQKLVVYVVDGEDENGRNVLATFSTRLKAQDYILLLVKSEFDEVWANYCDDPKNIAICLKRLGLFKDHIKLLMPFTWPHIEQYTREQLAKQRCIEFVLYTFRYFEMDVDKFC